MGGPTIPTIDQLVSEFETTYQDHFVLPKNNYDEAGNAIGAVATSLIPKHDTAEYSNAHDGFVRAYQGRLTGLWKNAREHGATGDGATDDSTAIQAALDAVAAAGGGTVLLPVGNYFCEEPLAIPTTVHLQGAGVGSHLIFTGATGTFSGACVSVAGTLSSIATLATTVAQGATDITLASAPALVAGDVFVIYNPTNSSFSPAQTRYRDGEFCRAVTIAGAVVEVDAPLFAAHDVTDGITCHKVNAAKGSIRGVRVSGRNNNTDACIRVRLADGYIIQEVWTDSSQNAGVLLDRCFESSVSSLRHFDHGTGAAGLNRGLAIDNCQRLEGRDMFLSATRHGLSTGSTSVTGGVPNRAIQISGAHCFSTENYSADMRGNTEHCTYRDCIFGSGMLLSGDHISLLNCTIFAENNDAASDSLGVTSGSELLGWSITIEGCRFYSTADQPDADGVLLFLQGTDANLSRGGQLRIVGNIFDVRGFLHRIAIISHDSTTVTDAAFRIVGNTIKQPDNTTFAQTFTRNFQVDANANCWVEVLEISNNNSDGGNWWVFGVASRTYIRDNRVHRPGNFGIRVGGPAGSFASDKPLVVIEGNDISHTNTGAILVDNWGTFALMCKVHNNTCTSVAHFGAGYRYGIIIDGVGSGFVQVTDNLIEVSGAAAQGAIRYATVGTLVERNTFIPAGSTTISKTAVTTEVNAYLYTDVGRRIVRLMDDGDPEGVKTAPVGSTYHRLDGPPGFYTKESGTGNTGWAPAGGSGLTINTMDVSAMSVQLNVTMDATENLDDQSTNSYDLTISGTVATYVTIDGKRMIYSREATRIDETAGPGNSPNLQITGALTLHTLLYQIDGRMNSVPYIPGFGAVGETEATNYLYSIEHESTGNLSFFTEYSTGTNEEQALEYALPTGKIVLLSLTRAADGKTCKLYHNGELVLSWVMTNAPTGGTSAEFYTDKFLGYFGQFVVCDEEQSAGTVAAAAAQVGVV